MLIETRRVIGILCPSPEQLSTPKRYAHRTVNTGNTPLITFFAFRGDAGHDYGTIETKGYRNMIVEKDGKAVTVPNPKWK